MSPNLPQAAQLKHKLKGRAEVAKQSQILTHIPMTGAPPPTLPSVSSSWEPLSPPGSCCSHFCSCKALNTATALTQTHCYWVTWDFPTTPNVALDLYSPKAQELQQSKRTITTNTGGIKRVFPSSLSKVCSEELLEKRTPGSWYSVVVMVKL